MMENTLERIFDERKASHDVGCNSYDHGFDGYDCHTSTNLCKYELIFGHQKSNRNSWPMSGCLIDFL